MTKFDFISGDDFRKCLEADYQEMNSAMEVKAWKAVHILAGSITEALLVEALIEINYQEGDPLQMQLHSLIEACTKEKILSEDAKYFSHAIRTYRNLIHPGRLIRLKEVIDEDRAKVAIALINIVAKDVAEKKLKNYGFTAEQIATKILNDSSTSAILPHLLKETKAIGKERLLLDILPQNCIYFMNLDEPVQIALTSIGTCFHLVFDNSLEETRKKATKKLVKVIKEESEAIASA